MLKKREVRSLLQIQTRNTINEDLKALGFSDQEEFTWLEFKRVLEMRLYLGLRPGINSREEFLKTPEVELLNLFSGRVNVDEQLSHYQLQYEEQYEKKHRVSVQLVLDRE